MMLSIVTNWNRIIQPSSVAFYRSRKDIFPSHVAKKVNPQMIHNCTDWASVITKLAAFSSFFLLIVCVTCNPGPFLYAFFPCRSIQCLFHAYVFLKSRWPAALKPFIRPPNRTSCCRINNNSCIINIVELPDYTFLWFLLSIWIHWRVFQRILYEEIHLHWFIIFLNTLNENCSLFYFTECCKCY